MNFELLNLFDNKYKHLNKYNKYNKYIKYVKSAKY